MLSFGIPQNQGIDSWKARQWNLDTNKTQTQTFEKSWWPFTRPLKLLIIPLAQPSNPILRKTFCLLEYIAQQIVLYFRLRHRSKNLIPITSLLCQTKICITYRLCNKSFRCCSMRSLLSAPPLAAPLPHHHPASSNNTYIPNIRKRHQIFNATKHRHISILQPSLSPCLREQKLPVANRKENPRTIFCSHSKP